jgi:hypothetical protein
LAIVDWRLTDCGLTIDGLWIDDCGVPLITPSTVIRNPSLDNRQSGDRQSRIANRK